jgi:hypothetical protein
MQRTAFQPLPAAVRALVAAACVAAASLAVAGDIGPSTTTEPYLAPTHPGVKTRSILTVGDMVHGYRMVGIPDGLGAFANGDGTFTLLVNHELRETAGTVRAHGAKGAFVSRWTIRTADLTVLAGQDFIQHPSDLHAYDKASGAYRAGADVLGRLCSADLAPTSAFAFDGLGTRDRIFLNGEESSPPVTADHGRALAWIATGSHAGQMWELPRLGRIAFENVLASPHPQKKTVAIGMDDAGLATDVRNPALVCAKRGQTACTRPPSELYVYVGTKRPEGSPIERAGLADGTLFGIRVVADGRPVLGEDKAYVFGDSASGRISRARFSLHDFGDVSSWSGTALQAKAVAAGVTQFIRTEDGAWDPRPSRRNDFYFTTTGRLAADPSRYLPSRLWRMRFDDVERPEAGGEIELVLDSADPAGKPGFEMLDNIAIDRRGRVVMQEDPGSSARLAKLWLYDTESRRVVEIAAHHPKYFAPGSAALLTVDEEPSGVIDAAGILGDGWFLVAVQAHYDIGDPELVQGGQLVALYVPPSIGTGRPEPAAADAGSRDPR